MYMSCAKPIQEIILLKLVVQKRLRIAFSSLGQLTDP